VYVREIDGEMLTFGVSGKLWNDALVMYDRQTRSLWSHVTGESIKGKLKGKKLTAVPSVQTTWGEWKKAYPNTKVLKKSRRLYRSTYKGYNDDPYRLGIFGTKNPDKALGGKEVVLGVRVGDDHQAAYPLSRLQKSPVVNDQVGDQPVVVAYSKRGNAAYAYYRWLDGESLAFKLAENDSILEIVDTETGSRWNAITGEAFDGPLAGKSLQRVFHTQVFWFAWRNFFPKTRLWAVEN
jgi:hypothetical protein